MAAFLDRFSPDARLLLSVGNVLGPQPMMASSGGRATVEAMDLLGVEAWLPSEHDFSKGLDGLLALTRTARTRLVTTNLIWQESGDPIGAPYLLFERGGKRIAVMGLLGTDHVHHLDVADQRRTQIEPPLASARSWARRIRERHAPDQIVALARLDLEQETSLLEADSGVDLVMGGYLGTDPSRELFRELASGEGKHALHGGAFGTTVLRADLDESPVDGRLQVVTRVNRLRGPWQPTPLATWVQRWWQDTLLTLERAWTAANMDLGRIEGIEDGKIARNLVAEICRKQARGEICLLPGGLFEDGALIGLIRQPLALMAMVRWEDALVTVDVPGSRLASLMARVRDPVTAGWSLGSAGWSVNGHPLDERSTYRVVITRPMLSPGATGAENLDIYYPRVQPFTVRRAVERELRALARTGKPLDRNYHTGLEQEAFWKSSLLFTTDAQQRNIDTRNGRYPELPWQSDRSGLNWGGEATWQLGTAWGLHDFQQTLQLAYRADQLAGGASQTSTDLIQAAGTYRGSLGSELFRPFGSYQASTRFSPNARGQGFLLGQFGGGISHTIVPGIDLREGLEFRRQFLDPSVPDRLGATLLLAMKGAWQGIPLSSQSRVFTTGDWEKEGILLDEEAQVSVPLGPVTALTLRFNAYKNTREAEWALRQLLGLSFRFDRLETMGS
jgi:hypothetical protein